MAQRGKPVVEKRRHTEVIASLVALAGRHVVDIGCGTGGLASWLASRGAEVLGIDAQPAMLAKARGTGVPVAAASADALPLASASVDLAVVFNSLHHFADSAAALGEARRVLSPEGTLYVAEPLAAGAYFTFMQPVDDETVERGRALEALADPERYGFAPSATVDYAYDVVVRDLESAIRDWVAVDWRRAGRIDAVRDELARRLATHGVVTETGYALEQPMRVWLMRPT